MNQRLSKGEKNVNPNNVPGPDALMLPNTRGTIVKGNPCKKTNYLPHLVYSYGVSAKVTKL